MYKFKKKVSLLLLIAFILGLINPILINNVKADGNNEDSVSTTISDTEEKLGVENTDNIEKNLEVKSEGNNSEYIEDSQDSSYEIEDMEVAENPDHLSGPMEIEAPFIDYNVQPEEINTLRSMSARSGELKPGEVRMTKTATPVDTLVNTWDIELKVEGRDAESNSDIVLVIDTSGSMKDAGRMKAAKDAATEFANQLLDDKNVRTRIAVVSFASGVSIGTRLTSDKDEVLNAIEGLYANGGTFTQSGVYQARQMLKTSGADYKNIVLLSDGEPTYSYSIKNPDNYLRKYQSTWLVDYYETTPNIPETEFQYNKPVGDGRSLRTHYSGLLNRNYYNHGNSAIAEAGFAKNKEYEFYTISLQAGEEGTKILKEMSSAGKDYSGNPDDLSRIFNEIGGEIISAAKNAKVTDPMGQGFTVLGKVSNIEASAGTVKYDEKTKCVDWTIGTLSEPISPGSDIKFATMKYRLEIDDDILNATSDDGKYYSTNGKTVLIYTDNNNDEKRINAEVPKVDPILLILNKKLINSLGFEIKAEDMGEDERFFDIHVTSDRGYDHTYKLNAGQKRIMTNLRLEDNYTIEENKFYGATTHSKDDYITSYNIYGEETNQFKIRQGNPDTPVIITNREKPLGELTVTKEFNPGTTMTKRTAVAPTFKFELIGTEKADGTSSLDGIKGLTLKDGKYIFELNAGESKTFKNLPYAEYQVVEIETNGFVPTYSTNEGKVALTISNKIGSVTVTNTPKDGDKTIDIEAKKIWIGGNTKDHIAVDLVLIKNGVESGINPTSVEQDKTDKNIFNYTWKGLPNYKDDGTKNVYKIKETKVPTNYKVDISGNKEEGFVVTNTYNIPKTELKVTKIWEGDKKVTRPKMDVELWRKIGTKEEKVEGADVKEFTDTIISAEWTGLEKTDRDGNEYTYFAKENFKDKNDINNENWTLGKYDEKTKSFTNSVKPPTGKLTISKVLENEPSLIARRAQLNSTPIKFKVKVTGPFKYEKIVELKAGQSETITGLYSGNYVVEEIETHGYTPSYAPESGKVKVRADETSQVTITNKNTGGGNIIDITVTKVWDGGLETNPKATIGLYRKGLDLEGKEINEVVEEFTATKDKTSETFTNLAKDDPSGRPFEYYVKETKVPTNYKVAISGNKEEGFVVTNTYILPMEVIVEKELKGGNLSPYEFFFMIEGTSDLTVGHVEEIYNENGNSNFDTAKFSKLEFKEVGTYSYRITEINTGDRKIQYDEAVYNLKIEITDSDRTVELTKTVDDRTEVIQVSDNSKIKVDFVNRIGSKLIIEGDNDKEKTSISGVVSWDDDNNRNKERTEKVEVMLLANNVEINSLVITENENWRYSFKNLDKVKIDGTPIVYTIKVKEISNYKAEIKDFDIMYKYIGELETD